MKSVIGPIWTVRRDKKQPLPYGAFRVCIFPSIRAGVRCLRIAGFPGASKRLKLHRRIRGVCLPELWEAKRSRKTCPAETICFIGTKKPTLLECVHETTHGILDMARWWTKQYRGQSFSIRSPYLDSPEHRSWKRTERGTGRTAGYWHEEGIATTIGTMAPMVYAEALKLHGKAVAK